MTDTAPTISELAGLGWNLLPVWWINAQGVCACPRGAGCDHPGKHPIPRSGVKEATTSLHQLKAWKDTYPSANWAVATGRESGVWVLDVDPDKGGLDSFEQLKKTVTIPDSTLRAHTGGDGEHYFFKADYPNKMRNRVGFLPGLDVRADEGYVLLAGSNHVSGGRYFWTNWPVKPITAPAELISYVTSDRQGSTQVAAGGRKLASTGQPLDSLDPLPEHTRNQTLFEMGASLRRQTNDNRDLVNAAIGIRGHKSGLSDGEIELIIAQVWKQDHSDQFDDVALFQPTEDRREDLWADVGAALDGGLSIPAPDAGSRRTDGLSLFYAGRVNQLVGDPEGGKTLVAIANCVDVMRQGGSCAVIDLDHNGLQMTLQRFVSFGADEAVLRDSSRFRYAAPEDADDYLHVTEDLQDWRPELVVVDSLGELMPMFKVNSDKTDDYATAHRRLLVPLAQAGIAVITIDHMAKNADSRAFGGMGSIRKKAAIDGVQYEVRNTMPFSPTGGGVAELVIKKDRPGGIRAGSPQERDAVAAVFNLLPPMFGRAVSAWTFVAGEASADRRATAEDQRVQRLIDQIAGLVPAPSSATAAYNQLGGRRSDVFAAFKRWSEGE